MTVGLMVSCLVIGWITPVSVILTLIIRKPVLLISFFAASLFALLAFSMSSLFYLFFPLSRDKLVLAMLIPFTVITELFRLLYISAYQRLKLNFSVVGTNQISYPLIPFYVALASGVGFGVTITTLLYGDTILQSASEGALFAPNACGDYHSSFVTVAIDACFTNIIHTLLMIIQFATIDHRKRVDSVFRLMSVWPPIVIMMLYNVVPAMLTNITDDAVGCQAPLILKAIILAVTTYLTMLCVDSDKLDSRKTAE